MPLKIFENKNFATAVRIIIGVLLIYASLHKISNPQDFAKIVHNYKLIPVALENIIAIFFPWIEFVTGLMLIIRKFTKGALIICSSLMVIFFFSLLQAALRGLDINCGCFSLNPDATSNLWLEMILDLIFLFLSINLYLSIIKIEQNISKIST